MLWMRSMIAVAITAAVMVSTVMAIDQMNPYPYLIANPPIGRSSVRTYRGEYFEIKGPDTTSQYSEVWWAAQNMPLPKDIVRRFQGKVMAITGYEVDLMRTGKDGKEESVPCYEQVQICSLENPKLFVFSLINIVFCDFL